MEAEALGLLEIAEIELDVTKQVGDARLVPVAADLAGNLDAAQQLLLGVAQQSDVGEHEAESHVAVDQQLAVAELVCQRKPASHIIRRLGRAFEPRACESRLVDRADKQGLVAGRRGDRLGLSDVAM